MVDSQEASQALAEMRRRKEQTLRQGSPRRVPAWYTYGTAASFVPVWGGTDLEGWPRVVLIVIGVAMTVGLTVLHERITGVRLRMGSLRLTPIVVLAAVMLVTAIVVGSVLRLYDVPGNGTIAGLAAALVWVMGMGRAQAAAGTVRDPA